MSNIFYLPIICCDQEMSEIWEDGKRIRAVCQICKKVWTPIEPNNPYRFTITKIPKAIIDPELEKVLESTDREDLEKYVAKEIGKAFKEEMEKNLEEQIKKILYGDGSEEPIGLLDFSSMHPSMGFRAPKPKNHYERMMRRRRK